jgi:hypothetical protein
MNFRAVLGIAVAATLFAPLAASAQDYDGRHDDRDGHQLVGRIVDARPYHVQLEHGPEVFLHEGTVIRPRGLTLRDGMPVHVFGHRTDRGFSADEIDLVRRDHDDRDRDRDRDGDHR